MGDDIKRNVLFVGATVLLLFSGLIGATLTGYMDWGRFWQDMMTARPPAEDPDLLWQRAKEYYADADKDPKMAALAKACCRRILILDSRHVRARKLLAVMCLKDKDFVEAEAQCQTVLLLDPTDLSARLGLASALRGQNKNKEALDIYRKIWNDPKANGLQKDEAARNLKDLDPKFIPTPPSYLLPTPLPSPSPTPLVEPYVLPIVRPSPVSSATPSPTPYPTPSPTPSAVTPPPAVVR